MSGRAADHPNIVGHAENLKGGDAGKAHGFIYAGKQYSATGKTGKSFHDQTPVRHFRETGYSSGEDVWLDDDGRVHADSTDDIRRLVERYEAHTGSGHAIPAGPVRHADSQAADRWYADQTARLTAAGYDWQGFTMNGATWRHPDHGELHIRHGISNPADPCDTSIYSTVGHGEKGVATADTPSDQKDVTDDSLKKHPMWSQSDFDYFKGKGYLPRDILEIWDRDWKSGKGPVTHDKAPDVVGSLTPGGLFSRL